MAARYKRYICTGNVRLNDVSVKGQRFMMIGLCTQKGEIYRKSKKGGPLKKYCHHRMLRFEDKKFFREAGLPESFWEMPWTEDSVEKFFEPAED